MYDIQKLVTFPFYIITHPFGGYEELKYTKCGSKKIAHIIVAVLFLATVAQRQMTNYRFNPNNLNDLNIFYILLGTVIMFGLFCIANWSVCTLLDGEGKFNEIWIAAAYALIPYVAALILYTAGSHFITLEETIFLRWLLLTGQVWSVFLMFVAIMQMQQYSFSKTLISLALTIVGIAFMIFLGFLVVTLFQQVAVFFTRIYQEIMLRL